MTRLQLDRAASWLLLSPVCLELQNVGDLQTGIAAGYTSGQIFYDVFNVSFWRHSAATPTQMLHGALHASIC